MHIALGLLLIGLVGSIVWQVMRLREPAYAGRSLSAWLTEYDRQLNSTRRRGPHAPAPSTDPEKAIRAIGTNAIPFLLERLRAHDSRLAARLGAVVRRLPFSIVRARTAMEIRREGSIGFLALGREANSAVPELAKLLDDPSDPLIARNAIHVLRTFNDEVVIPTLVAATTNNDPQVRAAAALDLGYRRSPANGVIQCLLSRLADTDTQVRATAASALGKFPNAPATIVPSLTESLRDPNRSVQDNAAQSLGSFGEKAKGAVPALVEIVTSRGSNCPAASALCDIDQATAKRLGLRRFILPPGFE